MRGGCSLSAFREDRDAGGQKVVPFPCVPFLEVKLAWFGTSQGQRMSSSDSENGLSDTSSHQVVDKKSLNEVLSGLLKKKNTTVLRRRKAPEKRLEEEKLEWAARKALRAEKQANRHSAHNRNQSFLKEKQLRRVATRGVVQLFNALREKMVVSEKIKEEKRSEHAKRLAEVSEFVDSRKKKDGPLGFLDLLPLSK